MVSWGQYKEIRIPWSIQKFLIGFRLVMSLGFGSGPRPNLKTKINLCLDYKFNSIHSGIEINKCLKFLTPKSFWVQKFLTFLKLFKKVFEC